MVQNLSLLCKTPMKFYHTQTGYLLKVFLSHIIVGMGCVRSFYGGVQEGYPAAYVKEPQKGLYNWVIDLDIVSSYPTAIITLNMSNETYYGRITGITEDVMLTHMKNKALPEFDMLKDTGRVHFSGKKLEIFNKALGQKLLCVAPCGSVFATTIGIIATVEKQIFYKRLSPKKMINSKRSC